MLSRRIFVPTTIVFAVLVVAALFADTAVRRTREVRGAGRPLAITAEWTERLERIAAALAARDTANAVLAWRDAYAYAVHTGSWEHLAAAGHAALRIGDAPEFGESSRAAARRSYLRALVSARGDGSLEGILRICDAFATLGDRDVVHGCVRIARDHARTAYVVDTSRAGRFARDTP